MALTSRRCLAISIRRRYQSCKKIDAAGEIRSQLRRMPEDQWRVVIPDHHPDYITRDQFLANRKRLADNRTNIETTPEATFVTRLRPAQLSGQVARQLPDQSTTLPPPQVIRAFGAHDPKRT